MRYRYLFLTGLCTIMFSFSVSADSVDIGIFTTTSANKMEIRIKPDYDEDGTHALTAIRFTLRWPVNAPDTILPGSEISPYNLQLDTTSVKLGYKYYVFSGSSNMPVHWVANQDIVVMSFDFDASSCPKFEITNNNYTQNLLQGEFLVEIDGNSVTGIISPASAQQSAPSTPGIIDGLAAQCSNVTNQVYFIDTVSGATAYIWSVPLGWTITSGQNTVMVTVTTGSPGQNGNISVIASNSCGVSSSETLAVTVDIGSPAAPGSIVGNASYCTLDPNQVYSINAVPNATDYIWSVPDGWTITSGQNTISISVTTAAPSNGGNVSVTANNSCGASSPATFTVTQNDAAPSTPGEISGISAQCPAVLDQVYAISAVANATGYTWSVPAGWAITAGQNTISISVTTGASGNNGSISVTANNSCGTSAAATLDVTVDSGAPSTPGAISGSATQCPALSNQVYSIGAVTNATDYIWAVPTNWTITAGQNTTTISVTTGSPGNNGNISVIASNSCTMSAAATLAVSVSNGAPATPGIIVGSATQCPAVTNQIYSISAVTNATGYTWSVPSNWTIIGGQNTVSISVTTGATGDNGSISVDAYNSCGTSPAATLPVIVGNGTPASPGTITGTATQCPALTNQVYSISAVPNATAYNWSVPASWTITAGQNTVSISVTIGATGDNGSVSVTANNGCGTSTAATKPVTVGNGIPASPGTIIGTATQCPALTNQVYSISPITSAAGYTWSVPANWTIIAGQNSTSISVTTGSPGDNGSITVSASNSCGTSAAATLAVTVENGTLSTPGIISGTVTQCPALTNQVYSISSVTNATAYSWSVPANWTITAGQNTVSISVTIGATGDNGSVSITASNSCGTSTAATLPVTVGNGTPATPGTITGTATQCPSLTNEVYSISAVTNATGYAWSVPAGWSITAGQNTTSISVTTGAPGNNGSITVTANNSCGTSAAATKAVTVGNGTPATPGTITGTATQCPSLTNQVYSISAVTNATGYAWSVPAGWSITAGQNTTSISVTTGASGNNGSITVTANNSCGTSAAATKAVTVGNGTPATPGTITGTATQCPSLTNQVYSIVAVTNATGYTWSVPSGWSITAGQNSTSISVTTGTTGNNGSITVTANNSCGTSAAATKPVTVGNGTPATPGAISGTATQCPALTNQVYSIVAVTNATGYTWSVPSGWSITAGQNSTSISVTTGATGNNGSITVTANNSCGTSAAATKPVTVGNGTPATPGTITGTATQCPALTNQVYSIVAVTNATAYAWSVPSGWSITAGQNSTSISVTTGATGNNGSITVTANNSCGTSAAATKPVTVGNGTPATPGTITGTATQCPTLTNQVYSIVAVTNATGYTWSVPAGWSITAGQNSTSISVTTGATGNNGSITVTANNSCGTSAAATKLVTVGNGTPATPGAITGTATQCPSLTNQVYSIVAVTNATGYTWSVPAGWSITAGQNSTSVSVTTGATGNNGSITVTANNSCGTSAAATKPVTVGNGTPATPGTIAGNATQCPLSANQVYSIAAVTNATSYTWAVPAGWTITGGQNTIAVTVTTGPSQSGIVSVTAGNSCGTSSASILNVTVRPNPSAGISGSTSVCQNSGAPTIAFINQQNLPVTIAYNINGANQTNINVNATSTSTIQASTANFGSFIYRLVSVVYQTAPGCSNLLSDSATISVTPGIGVPVFASGPGSTRCQGQGIVSYVATSANSTQVSYSLDAASVAAGNSITPTTGELSFQPNWTGPTTITATSTGCNGPLSSTHVVSITPTVGTPVFSSGLPDNRCQAATAVTYNASSSNSSSLIYSLDAGSLNGGNSINPATGEVLFDANWYGVTTISANGIGCNGPGVASFSVTVNPQLPVSVSISPSQNPVCPGDSVKFIATVMNGGNSPGLQWFKNSTLIQNSGNEYGYVPANSDQVKVIVNSNAVCATQNPASSATITVIVNAVNAGMITFDQTLCTGDDPETFFDVIQPTGSGDLFYQWQEKHGVTPWHNILFAANSSLYDPPVLSVNTEFRRIVTSTFLGLSCLDTSNFQSIVVNDVTAGSIGADRVICTGEVPGIITIAGAQTSNSGLLSYQWQSAASAIGPWMNIGANTNSFQPPAISVDTWFRCLVKSTLNGVICSSSTNVLKISINNVTSGIIANNQTICSGDDPSAFIVTTNATGSGVLSFQWQNASADTGPWNNINLANTSTFDPAGLTSNTWYRCLVTSTQNGIGCEAITNILSITINDISAGIIGVDQTICNGGNPVPITAVVSASGAGTITYQWHYATGFSGPWNVIPSAITASYDPPVLTNETWYHCVATSTLNGLSCSSVSNNIAVYINNVTAGSISGSATICDGENPGSFTQLSASTASGVLSYQWQMAAHALGPWNDISFATDSTFDPPALASTTYYRRITTSLLNGVVCQAFSNVLTITVNPLPEIQSVQVDDSQFDGENDGGYCQGDPGITINLLGTQIGINYILSMNALDVSTIYGNGSPMNFGLTAYNAGPYNVRAINPTSNCTIDLSTFNISVWSLPQGNPTAVSKICEGNDLQLSANTVSTYTYNWSGPAFSSGLPNPVVMDVNPADAGVYHLTVTDLHGCHTTGATSPVVVMSIPQTMIVGDTQVCENEYWVSYHSLNHYDTLSYYLTWNITAGNGIILTNPHSNSILVHWFSSGGLTLLVEKDVDLGCKYLAHSSVNAGPGQAPDVMEVLRMEGNLLICPESQNYTSKLWGREAKDGTATSFYDAFNNKSFCQIPDLNTLDYYYFIVVWEEAECKTKSYYNSPPVVIGIDDQAGKESCNLFPNPNSGSFQLELISPYIGEMRITIRDGSGRIIAKKAILKTSVNFVYDYLNQSLKDGFYIVELEDSKGLVFNKKMIVQ